jgi:phosphosulfolactate synthase (CoM biosynthesis protein A)
MDTEPRLFDFLDLAPRSQKPRTVGTTCIGDEGDPVPWVRGMLEAWGDYIDYAKFVPALLPLPHRVAAERVRLYRDFQIGVVLDDPIFGIAYYQGKAEQLLRSAWDMGFTHCQIDTKQVALKDPAREKQADEDQIRFSALAREIGFKLWGEVGQKHEEGDKARGAGGSVNVRVIVHEMKRLLAEGCEHVFLENRVMRDAIGDYGEKQGGEAQIREIVEQVGLQNIAIEIANQMPFEARNCHRFWAVRNFGPDVNFGGGTVIKEIRYVEAIRRGVIFVPGPSKGSSRLWVKSMAKNNGKAAQEWWREDYVIDLGAAAKLR